MMVGGAARQLRDGAGLAAIYAPPATPYQMPGVQYPPLFIYLTSALSGLSGLKILLAERLLAWGFYVASGLVVGLIVWQETRQRWAAIAAGALPFAFWSVIIFVHAARVDPLALFLSLLAAYFYRRMTLKNTLDWRSLGLIAGLSVAAFFTKQTYLAVTAAIFLDLVVGGRRLRHFRFSIKELSTQFSVLSPVLVFVGWWLGWVGLGFGLFGWWSRGEIFGIYDPARAGSFIFQLVPGFVGFFVLDHVALLILAAVSLRREWQQSRYFWVIYGVFAALSCITIIKDGAVDYYFNELAYVLSIAVGLLVAPLLVEVRDEGFTIYDLPLKEPRPRFTFRRGEATSRNLQIQNSKLQIQNYSSAPDPRLKWLLGFQTLVAMGMFLGWSHWKDFEASRLAYQEGFTLTQAAQAGEARGQKPGLILVNSFLLDSNRADEIGDYFIYSVLLKNGRRDMTPLLSDLETGRYRLIITETFNRWPSQIEEALNRRYNLRIIADTAGRPIYKVYTPN